jgi:hypothetical protein
MSAVLEDPSLNVDPIVFDPATFDVVDDFSPEILTGDDISAIVENLKQGERD